MEVDFCRKMLHSHKKLQVRKKYNWNKDIDGATQKAFSGESKNYNISQTNDFTVI